MMRSMYQEILDLSYGSSSFAGPGYGGGSAPYIAPPTCTTTTKYLGDNVHMEATPMDGTAPYDIYFRKEGVDICTYIGQAEGVTQICDHILTDVDISGALSGTIDFSVYITDSCPLGAQTCEQHCTITIGCLAPVCNFTVI